MKRVTISIDDALYERAAKLAEDRGVTIDEIVGELLARGSRVEPDAAAVARREMGEMARGATGGLGGWTWNREEAYAERLSRYERPDLRGDGDD